MNNSKSKKLLFVFIAAIALACFSCKSSNYSGQDNQATAKDTVSQTDLNESHEDLMTVDYKQFYDELAPHGEWIEVTSSDLNSDKPSSGGETSDELNNVLKDRSSSFPHITFGQLFGVNDAVAADANVGAFFVWRPDPSMAVSISAGAPVVADEPPVVKTVPPVVETVPVYRPYTNGQWVATDEGWYFKAPTPYEEITHHYGRWAYTPAMGWIWVPGRVRSPAWVDWREDDNNIAWTPVPPDVYVVNNVIQPVPVYEDRYVVVEKRYFVEPVVTQYVYVDKFKIKGMKHMKGIFVRDRVVYNAGPEFVEIERYTGRPVQRYNVVTMNNGFKNTWIENNNITTFAPTFTRVKEVKNRNVAVTQPEKFNNFQEVWNRENNKSAGNKNKVEDIGKQQNENKKESKELKQNNKNENRKLIDDSKMRKGEYKEKAPKNREEKIKKENTPKKESPRKEVRKEKKDNPQKDVKREKLPDRPKKDKQQPSGKQDRQKDNSPKGNDKGKDNPKRDKHK